MSAESRPPVLPLSFAQQRLWFLHKLHGDSREYNMTYCLRLEGPLRLDALSLAVETMVARHETLRTGVRESGGVASQLIVPACRVPIPYEDASAADHEVCDARLRAILREESDTSFDLAVAPLLRLRLIRTGEQEHVLVRTTHHLVSDGWSEGVFNRELEQLYDAHSAGTDGRLAPLPIQYADFTLWQRDREAAGELARGLEYWRGQLVGAPHQCDLPSDRPRPNRPTHAAGSIFRVMTADVTSALHALGAAHGTTPYMTLLAGLSVLLARYLRDDDVVIGSPVSNRVEPSLEGMIGLFVNVLPIRIRLNPEMRVRDLLAESRRVAVDAYEHQDVPFERIVDAVAPHRDLRLQPLVQVHLTWHEAHRPTSLRDGRLRFQPLRSERFRLRSDLEVHAGEREGALRLTWLYSTDLFDRERIEQMAEHLEGVLKQLVEPGRRVADLEVPTPTPGCVHAASAERVGPSKTTGQIAGTRPGYQRPRTPEQEILCQTAAALLGVSHVGLADNFFALGGHSLLAVTLAARIELALGITVPVRAVFEHPTVELLSAYLRQAPSAMALMHRPRPTNLPLSPAQQRLWVLDRLQGGSSEYNLTRAVHLIGRLNHDALHRAVNAIVARHEVLRTQFEDGGNGEPVQVVLPAASVDIPIDDLRGCNEDVRRQRIGKILSDERSRSFNLSRGPMLRARLLQLGDEEHIWVRTVHHVAFDGWSDDIFNRELSVLYAAFAAGTTCALEPLALQCADVAIWQREQSVAGALAVGLAYWARQLDGVPDRIELPADRPRPPVQTYGAQVHTVTVPEPEVAALRRVGRDHEATLFMTLLAAFAVLLSRYTGQKDVVIGSPIANRGDAKLESLIGFFINTLVLRIRPRIGQSFAQLLTEVRRTALDAYHHQDVPFERLVELVAPQRSVDASPLVQVQLAMHAPHWQPQGLPGLEATPLANPDPQVRFDIEVYGREDADGSLQISWLYNRDLFDAWRIAQMARHYQQLLQAVAADSTSALERVDVLAAGERRQLLADWNNTAASIEPVTLSTLFERRAARASDVLAVCCGAACLSYGELNRRANRLANRLRGLNVGRGTLVPIAIERSLEMVVAVMAIHKAGGAYVPIDAEAPSQRLVQILTSVGAEILLASRSTQARITPALADVPSLRSIGCLDARAVAGSGADSRQWGIEAFEHQPADDLEPVAGPDDLAYVIFTSGTTGEPKGVSVAHRPVVNVISWLNERYRVGPADRVLAVASLGFDLSVYDIFGLLAAGGTIELATLAQARDPEALMALLVSQPITVWNSVPAALQQVAGLPASARRPRSPQALRLVLLSGDWIPVNLPTALKTWCPATEVVGMGGATEAAIWSNWYDIGAVGPDWTSIPYGRPITNAAYYILDSELRPSPVGVPGALYIGGRCLARGYLIQPQLTASRFVADPNGQPGARMYRTGDLARWRPDGQIEFLGRSDYQVKIRGFRIELGDVETALRRQPGVREAIAVARGEQAEEKRLLAYVVPISGVTLDGHVLRAALRDQLPDYMIPLAVTPLAAFPVTGNGKVDRNALPEPAFDIADDYRPPRSPDEEILCGLFAELLGVSVVGIADNFFDIGGHSLMAIALAGRIQEALAIEVNVRVLFEYPTVETLSEALKRSVVPPVPITPEPRSGPIPLSFGQMRLWFVDRLEQGSSQFNVPHAQRLRGVLSRGALERAISAIVARHESLRTSLVDIDGVPAQVIAPMRPLDLPYDDLSMLPASERADRLAEALRHEARDPFDLARGPLLRLRLLRLSEHEHVLIRTAHHAVFDAWSSTVFSRELAALYAAFIRDEPDPLPPLSVQYADVAIWQHQRLRSGLLEDSLAYWKRQLAGVPERIALPLDRPRPAQQSYDADVCRVELTSVQTVALRQCARDHRATVHMTMLAAFAALLARHTAQDDIAISSPVATRRDATLEGVIGFLLNTLVMRVQVRPDLTFADLLAQVRQTVLDGYEHQDVPFERVVEELSPRRRLDASPIVQVEFTFRHGAGHPMELEGLEIEPIVVDELRVRFDLEVRAIDRGETIELTWQYKRDLFERWRIEQMARHYLHLLDAACGEARPHRSQAERASH